jgi:hypothetical protein
MSDIKLTHKGVRHAGIHCFEVYGSRYVPDGGIKLRPIFMDGGINVYPIIAKSLIAGAASPAGCS